MSFELIKETITINVSAAAERKTLYGREFLVAPATILVPGVLAGSKGPLMYPPDEVAKNPEVWNHKPLTLNHPPDTNDPEVLEKVWLGFLLNTLFDQALKSRLWFDVQRTMILSMPLVHNLLQGIPFELSTGLGVYMEEITNELEFNGKKYKAIARNYRPDHLAVLPNSIGACSIKDGCGVLVNELKELITNRCHEEVRELDIILNNGEHTMNREQCISYLVTNCPCWSGKEGTDTLNKMTDDQIKKLYDKAVVDKRNETLANMARVGFNGTAGTWKFNETTQQMEFVANGTPPGTPPTTPPTTPPSTPPGTPPTTPPSTPPGTPTPGTTSPSGVTKNEILAVLKGLTPAEHFEIMPTEMQEDVRESRRVANESKRDLVQQWVDNAAPEQKDAAKAWAEKQSLTTLREVVNQLPKKKVTNNPYEEAPDFSGRAGGVENVNNIKRPQPLDQYDWDFSEAAQSH